MPAAGNLMKYSMMRMTIYLEIKVLKDHLDTRKLRDLYIFEVNSHHSIIKSKYFKQH